MTSTLWGEWAGSRLLKASVPHGGPSHLPALMPRPFGCVWGSLSLCGHLSSGCSGPSGMVGAGVRAVPTRRQDQVCGCEVRPRAGGAS